ncbi:MAG TPA: TolC family protein [Tepidisphaeraceae bacterium]
MKFRLMSLLLIAPIAGGCAVDQKKEVEAYRSLLRISDETVDFQPDVPLPLRNAMLLANQSDADLAIRGEDYLQATIRRQRTAANFLPTVSLVPAYSRSDRLGGRDENYDSNDRSFDVPLSGSINVFNGLSDINRSWSDRFFIEQRRHELWSAQEQILLDTASIFYEVLRSEAQVRVLESAEKLQDERFRDARGRFQAGVASPLVALQTEAQVAQTRTTLISARADVLRARSQLKELIGEDVRTTPLSDQYEPPAVPTLEAALKLAEARDDLKAAKNAVTSAAYEVRAAIGQYYPSVGIDVTAFLYRDEAGSARTWDSLLSANIPIFSAGRIKADVRQAWSNLRIALLTRGDIEDRVTAQIEQAHSALTASDERLSQLQIQVAAANAALRQAEESYRAGVATNLDRILAQDASLQAQLQLASEQYDRKLFHLTLLQRMGVLREEISK